MDDSIRFECGRCGKKLKAPSRLAGRTARCPGCDQQVPIPAQTAPAAAPGSASGLEIVSPTPAPTPIPGSTPGIEGVRANRQLAGQPCPACQREIMLGEMVVQCPHCGVVQHTACWDQRGGCASPACAPAAPAAQPSGPIPISGPTKPCRACAEQIPANANVCPYCSERLDQPSAPGLPTTFVAKTQAWYSFTGTNWTFNIEGDQLVGHGFGQAEEIRVSHAEAPQRLKLSDTKLYIVTNTGRRKFAIDDIAHVALRHWLTGQIVPRSSSLARDALVTAIAGFCICAIILCPLAIHRANKAKAVIDMYPQYLTGGGVAVAAKVVGIIGLVLGILGLIINIAGVASEM